MSILEELAQKVESGDAAGARESTEKAMAEGLSAVEILNGGMSEGMASIGEKFRNNEVFVPELLIAARAMKASIELIKPELAKSGGKARGKVVIGTVSGDLHDIGKNLVALMLEGAGLDVVDAGVNVSKEKFVEMVKQEKPDILAMSALLTTTMSYIPEVMELLKAEQVRDGLKVIVGGAPLTQKFADEVGADGYSGDAASATDLAKGMLV